jgi:ribosomal protein S6
MYYNTFRRLVSMGRKKLSFDFQKVEELSYAVLRFNSELPDGIFALPKIHIG